MNSPIIPRLMSTDTHIKAGQLFNLLTPKEQLVAQLHSQGVTQRTISRRLQCSLRSVENHVRNACLKMNCRSRIDLIVVTALAGVIKDPVPDHMIFHSYTISENTVHHENTCY